MEDTATRRMTGTPRRVAELVMEVADEDVGRVTREAPVPCAVERSGPGRSLVTIRSGGMDGRAAEVHLDALWAVAAPALGQAASMEARPSACVLRVIEYVGPDDRIGPGVPIEAQWVAALALVGGPIDVDVYVQRWGYRA